MNDRTQVKIASYAVTGQLYLVDSAGMGRSEYLFNTIEQAKRYARSHGLQIVKNFS